MVDQYVNPSPYLKNLLFYYLCQEEKSNVTLRLNLNNKITIDRRTSFLHVIE